MNRSSRSLASCPRRRFGVWALAVVAFVASGSEAFAQVRGRFRVEAPGASGFVLHGTLPVRANTFPRLDGKVPFQVRDSSGALVPTQVQAVSRFANGSWGCDVVEVIARVNPPAGTSRGQTLTYDVVDSPQTPTSFAMDAGLDALLKNSGSLILVATDALGNRYRLDLLAGMTNPSSSSTLEVRSNGSQMVRLRTHGVLMPVTQQIGAPGGALQHLMGAHAYLTLFRNRPEFTLDLRIHNGMAGLNKSAPDDDPLSTVYFKSLSLFVRQGWRAHFDVSDPALGAPVANGGWTVYPLVQGLANGKVHYMPRQGEMHRRLALAPIGLEDEARDLVEMKGLGFATRGLAPDSQELWSWWNDATASYGTQRHVLPRLDFMSASQLDGMLSGEYWGVRTSLESGNPGPFPILAPALGWAHPWGISYGGATGGAEIYLYDGVTVAERASRLGILTAQMCARMHGERMPLQLWKQNGDPVEVKDVLVQGPSYPYVPMNYYVILLSGPDPFGFDKAPLFQIQAVQQAGQQPPYENQLAGYSPIDVQHFVRVTRSLKTLIWLSNDQLARDELRHAAGIAHLSYHEYPVNSSGLPAASGILGAEQFVAANPGKGLNFGRGEAWSLDAIVGWYALADDAWRTPMRRYFERVSDLVTNGQVPCTGFVQASQVSGWLGGLFRARSNPESAIADNALWAIKERVFRGVDAGRVAQTESVIREAAYGMVGMGWSTQFNAPWFNLAVTSLGPTYLPFCASLPTGGADGGGDNYQSWCSFAYGWELTGDPLFLQRATAMSGGGNLLQNLQNGGVDNLQNKAALLATLQ
jgi:hypothetical protein